MPRTNPLVAAFALALLVSSGPALGQTTPVAADPTLPGPPTPVASWTARIEYPIVARQAPGGRKVMQLQHYTAYSRRPAVYMVTESRRLANGKVWIRVQLPKRPNGSQGWVPLGAVVLRQHDTWIRVDRRARTVTVFKAGAQIKRFSAAVGTGGTPTPRGLFAVQDVVPVGGLLGPYIVALTAHSSVLRTFAGGDGLIGIHGWPDRGALGRAVSHGCVRMSRTGVRALTKWASAGVPIEIVG